MWSWKSWYESPWLKQNHRSTKKRRGELERGYEEKVEQYSWCNDSEAVRTSEIIERGSFASMIRCAMQTNLNRAFKWKTLILGLRAVVRLYEELNETMKVWNLTGHTFWRRDTTKWTPLLLSMFQEVPVYANILWLKSLFISILTR